MKGWRLEGRWFDFIIFHGGNGLKTLPFFFFIKVPLFNIQPFSSSMLLTSRFSIAGPTQMKFYRPVGNKAWRKRFATGELRTSVLLELEDNTIFTFHAVTSYSIKYWFEYIRKLAEYVMFLYFEKFI